MDVVWVCSTANFTLQELLSGCAMLLLQSKLTSLVQGLDLMVLISSQLECVTLTLSVTDRQTDIQSKEWKFTSQHGEEFRDGQGERLEEAEL